MNESAPTTSYELSRLSEKDRRALRTVLGNRLAEMGPERIATDVFARILHAIWNDICLLDHLAAEEIAELEEQWRRPSAGE